MEIVDSSRAVTLRVIGSDAMLGMQQPLRNVQARAHEGISYKGDAL